MLYYNSTQLEHCSALNKLYITTVLKDNYMLEIEVKIQPYFCRTS